jgi:hypothetical protein
VSGNPPIILATSAPDERPHYRRDFLTCVAAPEGYQMSFAYKSRWIEDELLADDLSGRPGLIVFCDAPEERPNELDFVAFRHVVLDSLRPAELLNPARYADETYLGIPFTLGPYVHASPRGLPDLLDAWERALRPLPHRPRPRDHETEETRFMFEHASLSEDEPAVGQAVSWRTLSENLARRESLDGSFFFRAINIDEAGNGEPVPVKDNVDVLETRGEYILSLDAHTRTGTPFADAIETVVTSDRLFAENPRTAPLGTSEGVKVLLTAGATTRSVNTTLVVRGRENFTDKAPRLELAVRIKPRYGVSALLILLIAIGAVLAGMSTKDLGLGDAAWGVKAVGGAIVGAAVFYAQGRTPGVGK